MFIGKYLNGQQNGKGKEYSYWNYPYSGELIFESEYIKD